jgi:hypothetical protein
MLTSAFQTRQVQSASENNYKSANLFCARSEETLKQKNGKVCSVGFNGAGIILLPSRRYKAVTIFSSGLSLSLHNVQVSELQR